jgi:hypothetical protein
MDRLHRDLRRALDFESMEVEEDQGVDRQLIERQKGLTREQLKSIPIIKAVEKPHIIG